MLDTIKEPLAEQICDLCGHTGTPAQSVLIRSNVRRFRQEKFRVWRCGACASIHCEKVTDLAHYYEHYPLRQERLGYFANAWFTVILQRLRKAGLERSHRILDYGCGHGLFLNFLKQKSYNSCFGYDPYTELYKNAAVLSYQYDVVVALDVVEHVESTASLIRTFDQLVKPGGLLCLQTPRAEGIDLLRPEEFIHGLHMPYHVHILSELALIDLCTRHKFVVKSLYHRWYQDSWMPCTSRRFIDLFMKCNGNDLDAAFDPPTWQTMLTTPMLWLYALFGHFSIPKKKDTMMIVFQKLHST